MTTRRRRKSAIGGEIHKRWHIKGQVLCLLIGVAVAGYLAYSYTAGGSMVCGPGGGCEAVRASAYAWIAGMPVPLVGLLAYSLLAMLLLVRLRAPRAVGYVALLGMVTISVAAFVFSSYLTYVELFVLQLLCDWCLASFLVTAAIAGLLLDDARREARIFEDKKHARC